MSKKRVPVMVHITPQELAYEISNYWETKDFISLVTKVLRAKESEWNGSTEWRTALIKRLEG